MDIRLPPGDLELRGAGLQRVQVRQSLRRTPEEGEIQGGGGERTDAHGLLRHLGRGQTHHRGLCRVRRRAGLLPGRRALQKAERRSPPPMGRGPHGPPLRPGRGTPVRLPSSQESNGGVWPEGDAEILRGAR